MRKQKKTVIWPVYFDSSKTRREGRKIPKRLAIHNPNLKELQEGAERLGLRPEVEIDMAHSAIPWQKTGRILVQSKNPKMETLIRIAEELMTIREQTKK